MNATPEHSSVVREIGRVLLRHRKKALLAFLLTVTAAVGVVVFWPRVYRSEARLFVRVGRESVALDPTATTEVMIPVTTSREVEINSVLEMLRSRAMLEQVVDVMGTERVLQQASMPAVGRESATPSWLPPSISLSRWIPALDPVSPKEAAVSKLLKAFDMHAVKRSSIICVGSEAASPELARDILKHLLDVYVAEHARLNRTQGSHDFFREQTELLRKQLADITETLRDTKNRFHLVSVDGQRNALQTELTSVETNLFQAEAALASSQGENQTLAGFLADTSERVMTDEVTGLPNQAGDAMRGQLYDLEIQEAEMASKFADRYPLLKAIREQRQRAEKVFSRQEARRTQWTTSVNPVHQQLQATMYAKQSTHDGLAAQVGVLKQQYTEVQQRIETLNNQEVQIARLERQADLLEASYRGYARKQEEVRMDEELKSKQITNVNVVQQPSYEAAPISPQKATVMVLGFVCGLFVAVGVAFASEYLDPSLKSEAEVEAKLALPLLVTIPRTSRRNVLLNR